jgi:CheY-like chemotaxis protein/CHASE3 domain sensor protein
MASSSANPISRESLRGGVLRSALPPKTQLGFAAATVAVFAIAFFSYRSFAQRAESARLVSHTLEVSGQLEIILSTYQDAETGQRGYLLTGDERYLAPYDAAVSTLDKDLSGLRRLLSDSPKELEQLEILERFGRDKMSELQQTIDLRRAKRPEAALELVRTDRGERAMDEIRVAVRAMKDAERALLDVRYRELDAATSLVADVTWGGSALLLFLIVAAAAMSSRDFLEQRIQGWLRSGQSELGTSMQGVEATESLGDRVAAFLGNYLGVQIGAVYFAPSRGALLRVGTYALPESSSSINSASQAGGLTRQAYQQNKIVQTQDVPADFFPVSSGLGRSPARHLVVVPSTADGLPNGAIELGSFQPLRSYDLELLSRLAEPIGVALRSTKDRADLREALEETQRQSEELQTQQEELHVQNEELEQQSRAMQESQVRLENQQTELEQINSHLEEQTQALEQQRDNLARAQAELQRASAYKSEFLANMSHELRTPLNSSLILAKLLSDNRDGNLNAEQIKFAETIYSAGNDLLLLINDILDLSKIEAGKLDIRPEEVVVQRLGDELGDVFRPMARDKGIDLTLSVESDLPATIVTDPTRLQQILKNLLSNAVKFTERGGVALRLHKAPNGWIAFDVKDTGIGIPAEQHELIFEAFRQADGTTNRKYGGTGLGLSISRDLTRLLGGELTLQSAPGRGSTFTLLLPERLETVEANVAATTSAGGRASAPRPPVAPPGPELEAPPGPPEHGGRLILVIEDDPKFASVIQDLARQLDFRSVVASTGEEGLAMAKRHRPSAIVLDVGLPDRSGLSVLDTLKHQSSTRHIPVHVVSVSDYTQTALAMGATGYAIKPVKRDELEGALRRLETKFTQRVRRILVVEDDEIARESTGHLLAGRDIEIVPVGTAGAALEQLGASTFDCMVLDLSLPDRSGLDLLEEMSKSERYAFPPVIVYTGRSLSRGEEQTLRKLSHSIIIKGARSPERLLDEVTLFLHQVESELPADRQRMLKDARHRESVFEGKRVLVVEDDVRNIFALSSVLEPRGAKVEIARNGREALDHLRENPGVDLVLMDIMMPEMDGLEAMRRIRKQPENATLPIIALTAKAMIDDREECLAAGANDYIAKPLDVDKLLSLARVWMPK